MQTGLIVSNREGGLRTLGGFPLAAGQLSSTDGIVRLLLFPDNENAQISSI